MDFPIAVTAAASLFSTAIGALAGFYLGRTCQSFGAKPPTNNPGTGTPPPTRVHVQMPPTHPLDWTIKIPPRPPRWITYTGSSGLKVHVKADIVSSVVIGKENVRLYTNEVHGGEQESYTIEDKDEIEAALLTLNLIHPVFTPNTK